MTPIKIRKTKFNKSVVKDVCRLTATTTHSLKRICKILKEKYGKFPSLPTIRRWLTDADKKDFLLAYMMAKQDQADLMVDEMLDIADDVEPRKEFVNKARLRIDTRKFIAAKLKPKVYADRVFNGVMDKEGSPCDIQPRLDYTKLNAEELGILKKIIKKCEVT